MWIAIPYFRVRVGVIFILIVFCIWLITTDLKWLTKKWTMDLIFIVIFLMTFIPYLITGTLKYGSVGPNIIIFNFSLFFVGIFINHYYMYYRKDYKFLGKIALFSLVFFTIGSLQTYFGLLLYPMASRELAGAVVNTPELGRIYSQIGIGGFGHVYSASFLFILALYPVLKKIPLITRKNQILIIVSVISILLMIIKASYAISLMMIFFGVILVFLVKNKTTFIFLIFLSSIFLLLIPQALIGEFFLEVAYLFNDNYIINEKFTDLASSFLYAASDGQTGSRVERYLTSLNTFLENPLFGIYGPFGNLNSEIGSHSGWFDLLGYFGLFTSIPMFLVLYFNIKKNLNFFKKSNYYGFVLVVYFLFLVFGTINPILYVFEIGFVLFCVAPAIPFIPYAFRTNKKEDFIDENGRLNYESTMVKK